MKEVMTGAMFFGLLVGFWGFVHGAEWVEFIKTDNRVFFYDKQYVSEPSSGITGVWVKTAPRSETTRQRDIVRLTEIDSTKNFSTYAYATALEGINCNT
jgi:hypothetical protein